MDRSRPAASSTSPRRPSRPSRRWAGESSTSASAGKGRAPGPSAAVLSGVRGAAAVRELARRHGIRPSRSMGQHFIVDPNFARAIATDAGVGPGDRVVEVGAGLGAITIALAETGADVLAVEFDRALVPALVEAVAPWPNIGLRQADALRLDWPSTLGRDRAHHPWTLCANLPYNIAMPLVLRVLEAATMVRRLAVIVQREVGDRLVARPGDERYGPASVRVAYHADATITRHVPASVFWPRPKVESVVVALDRWAAPPVDAAPEALWRVVDAGFANRRKTMRNALIRSGVEPGAASGVLGACGVGARARAQELSLERFACIAGRLGEPPR